MIEDTQVLEGSDVVVGQRCCGREPGDCRAQVVRLAANGETRWIRRLDGKTNDVFLAVDDEHRVNVVWSPEDEDCEFSTGRDTLACLQRRQTSWVRLDLDGACAVADRAVARPAGTR